MFFPFPAAVLRICGPSPCRPPVHSVPMAADGFPSAAAVFSASGQEKATRQTSMLISYHKIPSGSIPTYTKPINRKPSQNPTDPALRLLGSMGFSYTALTQILYADIRLSSASQELHQFLAAISARSFSVRAGTILFRSPTKP